MASSGTSAANVPGMGVGGIGEAVKIPELRRRVMFTLGMLMVYRVGVFVPTPGIDSASFRAMFDRASSTVFGMVNMFSGGALENFSIFALGIMPYISVSIIVQLLQSTWKPLEELSKEGEAGKRIITRYTRIATIVLAICQGYAISYGLEQQPGIVSDPGWIFRMKAAITLAAGTAFIMWLGEQITERGIGNGISLVISAGIIARMPSTLAQTFGLMDTGEVTPVGILGLLIFGVATIAAIVFVERSLRKIPVQYPRRAMGKGFAQASVQHLPLKLNAAGVIPPIFASALLFFPATIGQFAQIDALQSWTSMVAPGTLLHAALFSALIIFFAYFYTALVFDPQQIAENLKKNGGFIPTVRPGKDTADFISRILSRLTIWGALYMCLICELPNRFYQEMGASGFSYFFGGTAVLIVVSVVMDTISQIESHVVAKNYESFMEKGPGKIRGASRAVQVGGQLIRR